MLEILGVVLGLGSVFFVLSVFASHLQEMLSAFLTKRANQLEDAIKVMLRDPDIVAQFFAHPLIQSSATNTPWRSLFRARSGNPRPSYIPSAVFAKVLQSVLGTSYAPSVATIADIIKALPESSLKRMLSTVLIGATDQAKAEAAIQQWFDDTMARLSGVYKRQTQSSLLVIGFVLAVIVNANVVHMTSVLWSSADVRNRAQTLAEQYAHDPACAAQKSAADQQNVCGPTSWGTLNAQLANMPVGWTGEQAKTWEESVKPLVGLFKKNRANAAGNQTTAPDGALSSIPRDTLLPLLLTLLGWLGTAVAVSFGSGFWFDLINQVVNLRLSGPKPTPASTPSFSPARAI